MLLLRLCNVLVFLTPAVVTLHSDTASDADQGAVIVSQKLVLA
jgi:hypothetical protein